MKESFLAKYVGVRLLRELILSTILHHIWAMMKKEDQTEANRGDLRTRVEAVK